MTLDKDGSASRLPQRLAAGCAARLCPAVELITESGLRPSFGLARSCRPKAIRGAQPRFPFQVNGKANPWRTSGGEAAARFLSKITSLSIEARPMRVEKESKSVSSQ